MPRLKGYRFPREVVAYAVWAYHRFALSTADVEDLLAERGVTVSRETVRKWVNRFGRHFADCIKRDRPAAADKWHLDEVVVPINGVKVWLWRAVDANGDVLDILVQPRRNAKAAKRFLARLIARYGKPRVVVTDKLRSYIKPIRVLAPEADHRAHKGLNNRIEAVKPTDPEAREGHGPVQIDPTGAKLPRGPRSNQFNFQTSSLPSFHRLIPPRKIRCHQPVAQLCARNDRLTRTPLAAVS